MTVLRPAILLWMLLLPGQGCTAQTGCAGGQARTCIGDLCMRACNDGAIIWLGSVPG